MNNAKIRTFFALVASAVFPAILYMLASMAYDADFRGWALMIFPFVLLVTFSHSIFLGLPSILLLLRLKLVRWWSLSIVGFFVGILPSSVILFFRGASVLKDGIVPIIEGIVGVGVVGALGGVSFWIVWKYCLDIEERRS